MKKLLTISLLFCLYQVAFGQAKMQFDFESKILPSPIEGIGSEVFEEYHILRRVGYVFRHKESFTIPFATESIRTPYRQVVKVKNSGKDTLRLVFIRFHNIKFTYDLRHRDSILINIPPKRIDSLVFVQELPDYQKNYSNPTTKFELYSNAVNYPNKLLFDFWMVKNYGVDSLLNHSFKILNSEINIGKVKFGKIGTAKVLIVNTSNSEISVVPFFTPSISKQNQLDIDFIRHNYIQLNSQTPETVKYGVTAYNMGTFQVKPNDTVKLSFSFLNYKGAAGKFEKFFLCGFSVLNTDSKLSLIDYPVIIKGKYVGKPYDNLILQRSSLDDVDSIFYIDGVINKQVIGNISTSQRAIRVYDNKGVLKVYEAYGIFTDQPKQPIGLRERYDFDKEKPEHYKYVGTQY